MSIESKIQNNVPLADFSTYKIGGPAEYYLEIEVKDDLASAFDWAREKNISVKILGGGSNVLINSQGVRGLVIRLRNDEIEIKGTRLVCGAGATLARAVSVAQADNLSGLEWASGIPRATVGGSIIGNAGAFGVNMKDIVENVEVYNTRRKKFELFSNKDCGFSYRNSIFKQAGNYVIWQVILILQKEKPEVVKEKIDISLKTRIEHYPKLPSAGSVFKNLNLEAVRKQNKSLADYLEQNKLAEKGVVGAGVIIDKMLGLKGKTLGGAKISLEHANFIVNTSKATSDDVRELIDEVKKQAKVIYNLDMEEEVRYFGFDQ